MNTKREQKHSTWVSADDGRNRGTLKPYEDTGPAIYVETAGTWQNVAPATAEHTSGRDRARALMWRAVPLLIILGITITASQLAGGLGFGWFVATLLLLWGISGLLAYLHLSREENYHSSTGVEHHRIDSAETIAVEQIRADKDVRLSALRAYMGMLESKADDDDPKLLGGGR
jgi:hypothetical protein